jgi:transposase
MAALPGPQDDRCPRCGGGFHCGVDDAGPCACTAVQLDAALQQRLRERYTGCLCVRCLAALARGEAIEAPGPVSAA